jgi:four helix bundle protein
MGDSLLAAKSIDFAIRIINLNKMLKKQKQEYVISNQLLRSGTSIGANIREAKFAQSTADFISKMSIALKEANESLYWLELLNRTNYISNIEYDSIYKDCDEILRMLHSTVRTSKLKLNKST